MPVNGMTKNKVSNNTSSVGTTKVIDEKLFKQKSKFVRKIDNAIKTGTLENSGLNVFGEQEQKALMSEQQYCKKLLVKGYVQSYVDFYNLTHNQVRSSSTVATSKVNDDSIVNISKSTDDMLLVYDSLISAEISRRKGHSAGVFSSYKALASFYTSKNDFKTSIFFYEKYLDVAQLALDTKAEMIANHELGCVYYLMNDLPNSLKYHLRHEELAKSIDVEDEIGKANVELHKVYIIKAAQYEQNNEYDMALENYHKALDCAIKCWDKSAEAETNGNIGSIMLLKNKAEESLPYLNQQAKIASDMGFSDGRCRASSQLALAFDMLNKPELALVELKLVHTISQQDGDLLLQSKASKELGKLFSKLGRLHEAAEALLRHFNIANDLIKASISLRSNDSKRQTQQFESSFDSNRLGTAKSSSQNNTPTSAELDMARALVGISKGNLLMGAYVVAIDTGNIYDMLDWKLQRKSFIPESDNTVTAESEGILSGLISPNNHANISDGEDEAMSPVLTDTENNQTLAATAEEWNNGIQVS